MSKSKVVAITKKRIPVKQTLAEEFDVKGESVPTSGRAFDWKTKSEIEEPPEAETEISSGGAFFSIQKSLIHLIEEYQMTHLVAGKRMPLKAFCEHSGISATNMTAIISGNRWVAKCSRELIENLAFALEIPVLQVFILSGFIKTEDMAYTSDIEEVVAAIYRKMSRDKQMSYRAPIEQVWDTWPMSAKLSLCMMYEQMIGKVLFRYAAG